MPMAPRLSVGGSSTGGAAAAEAGSISAQAVDMLLENLRLGPVQRPEAADDIEEDEGVEDNADTEEDTEEVRSIGAGVVGIGGSAAARAANMGATETVLDFRDTGVLRQSGTRLARSGSHGAGSMSAGSRGHLCRGGTATGASGPGASPGWPAATPGLAQCEGSPIDLEQVLQALLLHQGLLEDHDVMAQAELGESMGASASRPITGAVSPEWRTLREMRRHGPLGELTQDAQTTLLGGTLYAYGGEEVGEALDSRSSIVFRGTHAVSTRGQRRNRQGGDSLDTSYDSLDASYMTHTHTLGGLEESHFDETAESLSQAGTAPAFANMLQLSLDRILQQTRRESAGIHAEGAVHTQASVGITSARNDFGFRFGGISGGGIADRSMVNTARSIRTVSSSVVFPQSPAGSGASVAEDIIDGSLASRPEAISREVSDEELRLRELEAAILDSTPSGSMVPIPQAADDFASDAEQDEGIISVVGFDSPRSMDTPALGGVRPPILREELRRPPERDLLDETGSVWGLGDTVHSSNSTVRSDSAVQTARTIEVGLEGVTGMFARLASENLILDESVTRSVRRVLQLGTVLTGQHLSEDEIRALPQVRFDEAEQQNCAICLEAYRRGEFLTSLRCGHFFHVDCLARWFQRSTQCPLCRSECVD